MRLLSVNPATGDVMRTFAALSGEELRQRIASAVEAARQQRATPVEHRILHLRKLSALLQEQGEELARTVALETGKPIRNAREEVASCAAVCHYYAAHAARLLAPELLTTATGQAHVQYVPVGVILAVLPWHSPLLQGFGFAVPALVAGNAVLMKHAATVPQCALHMAALLRQAGFPRGSFTALLMDDSLVETALNDENVAALKVVGSAAAGRALAAQAGWLLKKSALRLDGSDACVVMPSANLDAAVTGCVQALAHGAAPPSRIIIHADVYDAFASRATAAVEALRIGNPLQDSTELGPMGTAAAVQTMAEQVDAAVAAGGRVLTGGSRMVGAGHYFEPTLIGNVPPTAAVARGALSGPFALLFRARSADEALTLANATSFAGAAAVWTREPAEQQRLTLEVSAGFVALNSMAGATPWDLPSGGWPGSGYGRDLGAAGLREFAVARTVYVA